MVRHLIILSDSYSEHTRIALDILEKTQEDVDSIKGIVLRIKKACKDEAPFSTHSICADSEEWTSVLKVDPYFAGVKVIDSVEEFIAKIMKDRVLAATDVAQYILTRTSCSPLELQILCYLCAADYFEETGKPLFAGKSDILNGDLGLDASPNGCGRIIDRQERLELPRECRILFSENGIEKVRSINETLKKYGKFSQAEILKIGSSKNDL